MKQPTPHAIDRGHWLAGPWDEEPEDRHEWRDQATGLPCLMVRNRLGAWCGYVGVPPSHPWHGKDYDSADVDVHGGLTYANSCQGPICHIAQPGEPEPWWFGFDTAHSGDRVPGLERYGFSRYEQYRDERYLRDEVAALARQLAAVAS